MNWECPKNYPVEQVNIPTLKNYLKDRGWLQEPFGREEVLKFRSPLPIQENRYLEILIPSKKELIDYKRIVEIAIESISAFENRSFEDVLSQVLNFGDSLKFRISTLKTKKGNIPITDGIILYKSACDLLVYSTCAEISPQKNFLRKLKDAIDFVEDCLIGQSQYGSFIANIHCEMERPNLLDLEGNFISPLGRKSMLRILRGIETINEAIKEDSSEPIVKNYSCGLNANMCDTLLDIIRIGSGNDINISANLEPIWVVPEDIHTEILLQPSSEEYLNEASDILKGKINEEKCELRGYVFQLKRKPTEEENTIRLLALNEEGEALPVTIKLDDESYYLAIDAHKRSKSIQITGLLKKVGRIWYLKKPETLKVIDEVL